MTDHLTLTLAAWPDWIWIVIIGASIVGSMIGNVKKKSQAQRKRDEGHNPQQLEEMAARRRAELRQQAGSRMQTPGSHPSGGGDEPGNLTMAERIARARAKAQYEQRSQRVQQPEQSAPPQGPNAAQRRALAQRQVELERRRQTTRAQQQAQHRARMQAQQRARQQARQRAQRQRAHAQAQAQARQRGVLVHEHVVVPEPSQSTTRRSVLPGKSTRPVTQPIELTPLPTSGSDLTRHMTRDDLRKAIVMNEVLGKPVGLRGG